jgi:hypothetical protein
MTWIYETAENNTVRYVLGEKGEKPLICIGVNPSTAGPENLDQTLKLVKSFAKKLRYDGWLKFNLYPLRANPNDLPERLDQQLCIKNEKWICRYLGNPHIKQQIIWAAWGTLIEKRDWLKDCLHGIITQGSSCFHKWITIGKRSKAGHPHHPLYLSLNAERLEFDIKRYLDSIRCVK